MNLLVVAAVFYGGVYIYQRYKRRKANESVVDYEEAIDMIDNAEYDW